MGKGHPGAVSAGGAGLRASASDTTAARAARGDARPPRPAPLLSSATSATCAVFPTPPLAARISDPSISGILGSAANILLVGFGGFAGAIARYLLGGWVLHHTVADKFPWSTFAVNVAGCLVMGVLSGFIERLDWFTPPVRLLLLTGLLGGFTTFSAFGLETVHLLRRGEVWIAGSYALASVVVCVLSVWIGMRAVELLPRT
jgi:CrcB protein